MPIQDYLHVRFCGISTALNDDKAFAIRGEGIVRTGGLIPDLPLVEHVRFAQTKIWRIHNINGPECVGTFIDDATTVARPNGVAATVSRDLHLFARSK